MLGLTSSKDFVKNLSREAGIEERVAQEIADGVNKEVFEHIKSLMRNVQEEDGSKIESFNSSLERAGNFKIEPTVPHYGVEESERIGQGGTNPFTGSNQKDTVPSIKNPMKEPLVDQLLRGAAASPERKIDMDTRPSTPQPPRNLPTNDPYREPMK